MGTSVGIRREWGKEYSRKGLDLLILNSLQVKAIAIIVALIVTQYTSAQTGKVLRTYTADNAFIQYTGRIDFTRPTLPRFWQPGVYFKVRFKGSYCAVILNDEMLWGKNHNYIELVLDGVEKRIRLNSKRDTVIAGEKLSPGTHELVISKNTEANIGYLELAGIRCQQLLQPAARPTRKIEFIGNSITCGASSDVSSIPCGKGVWQDQHNAYLSYGAITGRELNAEYHLSAVSGIGLMHSCCNLDIIMPQVFDKLSMRDNKITWKFSNYKPDLVTICLGQNDGIQDSAAFCKNYIAFIGQVRQHYPRAILLCLSSPMADAKLFAYMKRMLTSIQSSMEKNGDHRVRTYFFSKQYHSGCDSHPDLADHRQISKELVAYIRKIMSWK